MPGNVSAQRRTALASVAICRIPAARVREQSHFREFVVQGRSDAADSRLALGIRRWHTTDATLCSEGASSVPERCDSRDGHVDGRDKRCQEPISRILGRPRGRVVISRPRALAVSANHESSPNGQPRSRLRWIAESSSSV